MSVTDEQIIASYTKTASVWKTGEELGLSGQTVHRRLQKIGAINRINNFTANEEKRLKDEYLMYRDAGKLNILAQDMGRTKQFLCRQAGRLGLTDRNTIPHSGKFAKLPDEVLRELILECARSSKTIGEWCATKGYSEGGFRTAAKKRCRKEWEALQEAKQKKSTNYQTGRSFEYATKRSLEKAGFTVMRSPASKSPADLFAVKDGRVAFVQCKIHGAIGFDEWNSFYSYCEQAGALPLLAQRNKTGHGIYYLIITGKKSKKYQKPYPQKEIDITELNIDHELRYG